VSERSLADLVRGDALLPAHETYVARADSERALRIAGTSTPFTIAVRFLDGLDVVHRAAFAAAADRWARVVVGELPGVLVDGEYVDDVLVVAQGVDVDGPGRTIGQAGPTHLRPPSAGRAAYLPAKGVMSFDTADLARLAADGTLVDVLTHELGHVLGFGSVWKRRQLIGGEATYNPTFSGEAAMAEYRALRRGGPSHRVPVENAGGSGTLSGHWRSSVFRDELMTATVTGPGARLSRLTVASLGDLGYDVDLDAADPYTLPSMEGALPDVPPPPAGTVLPVIPVVLPDESLDV
jgi:hypothetical protein